jgi:hypothetical protein
VTLSRPGGAGVAGSPVTVATREASKASAAARANPSAARTSSAVNGSWLSSSRIKVRAPSTTPLAVHSGATIELVPVRVGDGYGAGRVAAIGVTRYLPHVPPGVLQAVVTNPEPIPGIRLLCLLSYLFGKTAAG